MVIIYSIEFRFYERRLEIFGFYSQDGEELGRMEQIREHLIVKMNVLSSLKKFSLRNQVIFGQIENNLKRNGENISW